MIHQIQAWKMLRMLEVLSLKMQPPSFCVCPHPPDARNVSRVGCAIPVGITLILGQLKFIPCQFPYQRCYCIGIVTDPAPHEMSCSEDCCTLNARCEHAARCSLESRPRVPQLLHCERAPWAPPLHRGQRVDVAGGREGGWERGESWVEGLLGERGQRSSFSLVHSRAMEETLHQSLLTVKL